MTKVCTKCGEEKELDEFVKSKRGKYGKGSKCRRCRRAYNLKTKEHRSNRQKKYYQKNKEKIKRHVRKYVEENREEVLAKKREYTKRAWRNGTVTEEQKQKRIQWTRTWRRNNPEKVREYNKKYKEENKALCNQISLRRRAKKIKAQPKWVDEADLVEMYEYSKEVQWLSEEPIHVDHIIPLCHPDVCGLHVPWNLQLIPASENFYKNNKFDGTYDNRGWKESYE